MFDLQTELGLLAWLASFGWVLLVRAFAADNRMAATTRRGGRR